MISWYLTEEAELLNNLFREFTIAAAEQDITLQTTSP